jgi:hypothetical protein
MKTATALAEDAGGPVEVKHDADRRKQLSDREIATIIGVLFIIGTVAGVLSYAVTGPILNAPDYLARVATHQSEMALGALLVLTMVFSLAMVPVVFYPVARRYSKVLAMGYVVFRGALEQILVLIGVAGWLVLVALSKQPTAAVTQIADSIKLGHDVSWTQLTAIPFSLGALMFYYVFYTSRLLPRWLSVWGLVGAVLYLGAPLMQMFGLPSDYLMGPLALQEMVMAVWLIVRGFSQSAREPRVAGLELAGQASR